MSANAFLKSELENTKRENDFYSKGCESNKNMYETKKFGI